MRWFDTAPTILLFVTLLYLPGWLILRLLGVRGLLATAVAPAPVVGIVGAAGVALDELGIGWSLPSVTATLLAALAAVALIARWLPKRLIGAAPLSTSGVGLVLVGLLVGSLLQLAAYLPGMRRPDALHQINDAIFQLNATQAIIRTGTASSFSVLGTLQGNRSGAFYPIASDAIAALAAPTSSTVAAVNILMLVMLVVVWPISMVALARVVAPHHPAVAAAAPVIAVSFIVFPDNLIALQGLIPYGLALALAPGVAALTIVTLQGRDPAESPPPAAAGPSAGERTAATWPAALLVVLLAVAGVAAAHPSGLAVLVIYLLPKSLELGARASLNLRDAGRRGRGWVVLFLVPGLLLAVLTSVFAVPPLRAMTKFPAVEGDRAEALLRGFSSSTTIGSSSPWANSAVTVLLLIGLTATLVNRRTRWFGFTWLLALSCFVIASGPDSVLRDLTGFWYESAERTEAMLPSLSSIVAAVGALTLVTTVAELVQSAARRRGPSDGFAVAERPGFVTVLALVTVLFVAYLTSGGFRLDERRDEWTAWGFQPEHLIHPPYVTDDELTMIRSLADLLPGNAVVLGDPFSGAPFVQGVAGLVAYIPHVNPTGWDDSQKYLMQHFADLHTDPRVCEIVRNAGIQYFYWDVDNGAGWSSQSPGLSQVDTGDGFELVAAADTAKVYRITACQ